MKSSLKASLGALLAAQFLVACGGGSDAAPEPAPAPPPPAPTSAFTKSATWTFALPAANQSICYDFDTTTASADCSGANWDLKVTSGARGTTLWTNSGTSGSGKGGAYGSPFDHTWANLSTWTSATKDPSGETLPSAVYAVDTAKTVFTGTNGISSAAFEYGLGGSSDHNLWPSYRTFLITTDSTSVSDAGTPEKPVYALQVIGYYDGTASGHPKVRWVDRSVAGASVRETMLDASAGWVYLNLATGLTATTDTGDWHIAFNRYNVKLNGGASTTTGGTVAGFVGKVPAGFYDGSGAANAAALMAATPDSTLADLTASDMAKPAAVSAWVKDSLNSALNPAVKIGATSYDYGWYSYNPGTHMLTATPDGATLIRSGEGGSYARVHLTSITYADPASAASQQTWTFYFDVAPAAAP